MHATKERFFFFLGGCVPCAVISVFCAYSAVWHAAILFAAAAVILAAFAINASESYCAAKLISDNPILSIGMASVSDPGGGAAGSAVKVTVSGFGILMDGRPYKFGHGGIDLTAISIDRESITLSFGGEGKAYCAHMLHGVADRAEIERLVERLRYETGVAADVSGW